MFNIGPGELLVILVIALVVLGPSRLPATARTMGRVLARTRQLISRFQQEMQAAADAPLEALARERGRTEDDPPKVAAPGGSGTENDAAAEEEPPAEAGETGAEESGAAAESARIESPAAVAGAGEITRDDSA